MSVATILVVENDAPTRSLIHGFLAHRGHRVVSEGEGEWALGVVEAEGVSLLVLDQRLHDLSGVDVLRRLRSQRSTRDLPVILIGGPYAEPPAGLDELAPVTFLDKPLDLDRLEAEVDAALSVRPVTPKPARGEADARSSIPVAGDLSILPFARLVGRLAMTQADGALLLSRSAVKKVVFFEGGRPVFVQSNLVSESIGQVLIHERLVTEPELEAALLVKRRTGRPLGDVLVEAGTITEHHLAYALERQMEQKLFDLFTWAEGRFRYRPETRHDGPRITLPLGPVGLVFDGVSRMAPERLERDLISERHRFARARDEIRTRDAVLAVEPSATAFLERLDGTRSVEALFRDPELPRAETLQLLYALIVTGQLHLSEPPPPVASGDLRDRVRARLDAEMRRIETTRQRALVPKPTRPEPLAPDDSVRLDAALKETAQWLQERDYFARLQVSPDADEETLRAAYHRASRELEPQRLLFGKSAPQALQQAEANHLQVVRAFQVLSDPSGRSMYAEFRADPRRQLLPVLAGADAASRGDQHLAAGRYRDAVAAYRDAETLDPSVPAYGASAAFAEFAAGGAAEIALQSIRARREESPEDPECMRLEARVLAATGDEDGARVLYRSVHALDPTCLEARRVVLNAEAGESGRGVMAKVAEGARAWLGRSESRGD